MKIALKTAVGIAVIGGVLWWMRLMAHSKSPAPEGRWREVDEQLLQP